MDTIFDNFVNGNLEEAKEAVKRKLLSASALASEARERGYGMQASYILALWLKGDKDTTYQQVCDATHR